MNKSKVARFTALASLVVVLATALLLLSPSVRFAYRNPGLHLVLETAEAFVAGLTAFLVLGRFRRAGLTRDLILSFALGLLGAVNLASVAFALVKGETDAEIWGILFLRLMGASAFAYSALASFPREGALGRYRTNGAISVVVGGILVVIGTTFAVLTAVETSLPDPLSINLMAGESARPVLEGHPLLVAIQGLSVVLYASAATGYMAAARRERDDLWLWFGAGAILATGARVNYLLFPSLYSEFVYTGDLLRLAFYVLLLIGAAREIHTYWEKFAEAAVSEERRALARELHDGVAQELVFIAAQSKRLERGKEPDVQRGLSKLSSASDRAVAGARRAIHALVKSADETLAQAVAAVASDSTSGSDLKLVLELDPTVDVPPPVREGLLRIMGEAIRNAIRHSGATTLTITLRRAGAISFTVVDDGVGFDSEASRDDGFGLVVMREQAKALGGSVAVLSEPGQGTKVEVTLDG